MSHNPHKFKKANKAVFKSRFLTQRSMWYVHLVRYHLRMCFISKLISSKLQCYKVCGNSSLERGVTNWFSIIQIPLKKRSGKSFKDQFVGNLPRGISATMILSSIYCDNQFAFEYLFVSRCIFV